MYECISGVFGIKARMIVTYRTVGPALLDAGDSPQLMDVLSQFFSDALQVRGQHNLLRDTSNKPKLYYERTILRDV